MRATLLLVFGLVGVAGGVVACAQPEPVTSSEPLPELAVTAEPGPEPTAPEPSPEVAPDPSTAPAPPTTDASPPGDAAAVPTPPRDGPTDADPSASDPEPDAPADAPATRQLLRASDRRGDAGIEGPDWADLVAFEVIDAGADLVARVELAGPPPARLGDGEVVGIGIDLFAPGADESSHQLFVDGGSDGWRAYLQTPDGFVAYPGGFTIVGAVLELRVPWPSVGDPAEAEARVFLDWSRRAMVTNLVARDDLPDRGRVAFDR